MAQSQRSIAAISSALVMIAAPIAVTGCASITNQSNLQPMLGGDAQTSTTIEKRKQTILALLHEAQRSGRALTGTQVNEREIYIECDSSDRLTQMTGKEPAILGLELGYPGQFRGYDDLIVQHAVEHAHRGGLVTLTWHAPNPLKECELGKEYKCSLDRMSDEEFALMLKPGTRANAQWIEDIAGLASILKRLEAEGVVVLFRPLHEMNGRWFWWGKREKFPELWESLFDKLIDDYGLTNLITVWAANGDASDAAQYFPTAHLPDVVGTDVYRTNNGGPDFLDGFRNVSKLAPDSLFTYAEVGHVPDPVTMATARPAWVLVWGREFLNGEWGPPSTSNKRYNTREETVAFFKSEHTMGLEELPMSSREMIAGRKVSMPQRPLCPDSWP